MEGREIKSMLLKSNDRILPDGTCSECDASGGICGRG